MTPKDIQTHADVVTWLKHHVEWNDEASRDMMLRAVVVLTPRFGVWCVEDRTWCPTLANPFIGTREQAEAEVLHWRSGKRADVQVGAFHYDVREYR